MKLREAFLCLDCDEVYALKDSVMTCCPSCGSKAAMLLSNTILTETAK